MTIKSFFFCVLAVIGGGYGVNLISAEQLYREQPTVTPELANPGPYPVGVTTMVAANPDQLSAADFKATSDRILKLELWYPAGAKPKGKLATYPGVTRTHQPFELAGTAWRDAAPVKGETKYPLVVISHGYTGYRTIMFYLAEHLASHGYVVAGIDHTDSTNAEVNMAEAPFSGFISTLINRSRDQQFVLEYLGSLNSPLGNMIDADRAAIIGYSMGGYGAINTVGSCFGFSAPVLQQFGVPAELAETLLPVFNSCNAGRIQADPRWRAMIAIAPWGGENNVHHPGSMQNIKVPTLYIAGDQDDISGYENGIKKLFQQTGSEQRFLMVYENARHNIAAHPAPRVAYDNDLDIGHHYEPAWDIETVNRINEHIGLAFLDCYVKQKQGACDYLPERESITQKKQEVGMSPPWPGFKDRWGTGVRFYRGQADRSRTNP